LKTCFYLIIHLRSYGIAAANLYEPPPPSYQAAQATNNHFAGKLKKKNSFI